MSASPEVRALRELAEARGVLTSYEDAFHRRRDVAPDSLLAVLAALGEPVRSVSDAPGRLSELRSGGPDTSSPVVVAWDGVLPPGTAGRLGAVELEGGAAASDRGPLPLGLHRAEWRHGSGTALVISAPTLAPSLATGAWGIFAPTYALVSEEPKAAGDLSDLERLGRFTSGLGGSYLATLPLLADYSKADHEDTVASPYSPVSRMWWNEAYLDVGRALRPYGGLPAGPGPRAPLPESPAPLPESPGPYADVAAAGAAVTRALEALLEGGLQGGSALERDLAVFRAERPDVESYARFRAAVRTAGTDRAAWPTPWAGGEVTERDVPSQLVDLHVLAQLLADRQLAEIASATRSGGCRLMLDLPIGCRPDGFDTWAFPSSFAAGGASVGAPPDRFFSGGQDWGFRPLDPETERRAGYPVLRRCLSHQFRHAGAVRIDHILGLQRLWWIPPGASATDGAYVRYPLEELVALTCLEASRHGAAVIGEDLGTVDDAVRDAMASHRIGGMHVAVFDLERRPGAPLRPSPGSAALLDTHDTATFAGWSDATDIDEREKLGLVDAAEAGAARQARKAATSALRRRLGLSGRGDTTLAVHAAVLEELGRSEAGAVMVTLEDLWGEHDPQNIPGNMPGHVNFARRFSRDLSWVENDESVAGPLRGLQAARSAAPEVIRRAGGGKVAP